MIIYIHLSARRYIWSIACYHKQNISQLKCQQHNALVSFSVKCGFTFFPIQIGKNRSCSNWKRVVVGARWAVLSISKSGALLSLKKRNYSVRQVAWLVSRLLISKVRREWEDCFKVIHRQHLLVWRGAYHLWTYNPANPAADRVQQ